MAPSLKVFFHRWYLWRTWKIRLYELQRFVGICPIEVMLDELANKIAELALISGSVHTEPS